MDPYEIFETEIKPAIPPDLPDRVLAVVARHRGKANAITRKRLLQSVFGYLPKGDLANSREDRQMRLVLLDLQGRYPILSSSGRGGYFYAESAEEIDAYASELESRAAALHEKSRKLHRLAAQFHKDVQMRLPYGDVP